MNGYAPTARISPHAHERMEEMHVSSKRVKRLVRDFDLRRCSYAGRWVVTREDEPDICVVYVDDEDGTPLVVTVLVRSYAPYVRGECT